MASQTHLDASVSIGSPASNAILSGSFTMSGTASCDLLKDLPEEPDIFVRHANEAITRVQIRLGSAGPFTATPTGPAATPWISWAFTASSVPNGPLMITAHVFASLSDAAPGRDVVSRPVIVDVMPPTLTITLVDHAVSRKATEEDMQRGVAARRRQDHGRNMRVAISYDLRR